MLFVHCNVHVILCAHALYDPIRLIIIVIWLIGNYHNLFDVERRIPRRRVLRKNIIDFEYGFYARRIYIKKNVRID